MGTNGDAERCIKYLNRSVSLFLKAKRSRGRTPTPGKYCGPRDKRDKLEDQLSWTFTTLP
ncbi:hypothetical protein D0Y65_053906 [Glycine soja]|uniref:Uncharacterized protein n=2 Tax=Glycine subgen. Soja TaxID=1462606 RepID=C6TC40_SOYBN|nr:unknown [Glycine max]KAG4907564.1 hypothetical protein JHK86_056048 [Glycine max]RZB43579.1 hypothetical protein D0Y65_053906 [Glycine soja]RZB43580.1 hypothetical protein D0Y65_053906 [Glycine soja]RZB43581.1 hypothetical protein D0Y65_053906 [Glycine soja]